MEKMTYSTKKERVNSMYDTEIKFCPMADRKCTINRKGGELLSVRHNLATRHNFFLLFIFLKMILSVIRKERAYTHILYRESCVSCVGCVRQGGFLLRKGGVGCDK